MVTIIEDVVKNKLVHENNRNTNIILILWNLYYKLLHVGYVLRLSHSEKVRLRLIYFLLGFAF